MLNFISVDLEQSNKIPSINMVECQGFFILLFIALERLNEMRKAFE